MKERAVVDLRGLSPYATGSDAPLWWGFWGIILIESTVFASLVASYFYLRFDAGAWPPAGEKVPELLLPTVNTAILLASSGAMLWADRGIEEGKQRRLAAGLALAIALALTFLALKYVEYSDPEYRWDSHAYGSIVWTIVGFHSAHVTALVLKTIVIDVLAWRGYFTRERRLGVVVNGIYWHFVVAVWIPLYLVLYWVPRL